MSDVNVVVDSNDFLVVGTSVKSTVVSTKVVSAINFVVDCGVKVVVDCLVTPTVGS